MFNRLARMGKSGWIVAVTCLLGACQDYGFEELPSSVFISKHQIQVISLNPVDILFVVDNSGSMAGEQSQLGTSFASFYSVLNDIGGNYHIALVTTGISSPGCKQCSVTNTLSCINMNEAGTSDIENGQFQYRRGHITWNGTTPVFDFLYDETCRVVTSDNLTCFYDPSADGRGTVLVGINGCGYERGLEAMKQALSSDLLNGNNNNFLRNDSSLAVIIVSDEDDCGVVGSVSELGGKDSYCYHAAKGDISPEGNWTSLPPVENYHEFLLRLKGNHKSMVKFAAIVGLSDPANVDSTTITFDGDDKVNPVCSTCGFTDRLCSAMPGTRYRDLYKAFGQYGFIDTICKNDFSTTMENIAKFVTCPGYFNLVEAPLDIGLANILVNGVPVPRYSCTELVDGAIVECTGLTDTTTCTAGTCVETWSYERPEDIVDPDPPVGGRINFASHYNPCTLINQGTVRIELVYVVK
jgi:hypothetical protein